MSIYLIYTKNQGCGDAASHVLSTKTSVIFGRKVKNRKALTSNGIE